MVYVSSSRIGGRHERRRVCEVEDHQTLGAQGLGAAAAIGTAPDHVRYAGAQNSAPFASASRRIAPASAPPWPLVRKTTMAATKLINDAGGITGRPVEIDVEDDGTDPGRGAEVVGKFATQHKVDVAYGTLFSHVVIGSAPVAGEFKLPYFVVSEGHHVASTKLNRYVFQPGITDVKSQIQAMAPWIAESAEGHADLSRFRLRLRSPRLPAAGAQGAGRRRVSRRSPFRRLLHEVFSADSGGYRGPIPCDGQTGGADLRQRTRRILRLRTGRNSSASSIRWSCRHQRPGPPIPRRQPFLGRFTATQENGRRRRRPIAPPLASTTTAHRSTIGRLDRHSHVRLLETLYVIKQAMEACSYQGPEDRAKLVEATEAFTEFRRPSIRGRPDLQRQDTPVLRSSEHLEGGGRQAEGGAPDRDRGQPLRAGRRLHDDAPVTATGRRILTAYMRRQYLDGIAMAKEAVFA